jgi:hypothetical protein
VTETNPGYDPSSLIVVKPATWSELVRDLLSKVPDYSFVCRGQRRGAWGLQSSLERAFNVGGVPTAERDAREQRAFSYFRAHAATYLNKPPADTNILDWLVIMQHYGAPTRLLDWTESPFVATYFAYRDMPNDQMESAALWLFDTNLAIRTLKSGDSPLSFPAPRDVRPEDGSTRDPWVNELNVLVRAYIKSKAVVPLPVVPVEQDARMIAQQTILTVDANLNGGIPYPLTGILPTGEPFPLLFKVELPAEWRRDVLQELALMGITDAGLFPDVGGVAGHASRIVRDDFLQIRSALEGY